MEKPSLTGYKEFISTYNSLLTQADNLESDVLDKRDEIEEDASMSKEDKHTWKVYLNKVMRYIEDIRDSVADDEYSEDQDEFDEEETESE